jgi:hypothetical protein
MYPGWSANGLGDLVILEKVVYDSKMHSQDGRGKECKSMTCIVAQAT